MSWHETTLGPHIDLISGPAFKSQHFTDDPSDVPLVKGENIGQGMILWDKSKYWPRGDASQHEKFKLQVGDVVLAMDRPWVSAGLKFAVISERDPESLLVQRVARIRGVNRLDSKFLRYVISSPQFSGYIKNVMGGTNVPHISGDQIRSFRFLMPSLGEQKAIATILSTYDDLIENNRRRIQLLEQAARLLYKEWFVHLRFPGHEHVKIKDGVPEGWEKKPLGELAPFKYGKALKEDDRIPGLYPVYGSSGIVGTHDKALVAGPAIIVGRKGNVGSVYWSKSDFHPIDTVYYIEVERCSLYLYYALLHTQFISTDVAVPGLNRDYAHSRTLLVPDDKILRLFEQHAGVMHDQIDRFKKYSQALTKARDLLLPRLMNGELFA